MKVKTVRVTREMKLAMKYNSAGFSVSLEAELEDGDSVDKVFSDLDSRAEDLLKKGLDSQLYLLSNVIGEQ